MGFRPFAAPRIWAALLPRAGVRGQVRAGSILRVAECAARVPRVATSQRRWAPRKRDTQDAGADGWERVNKPLRKAGTIHNMEIDMGENPKGKSAYDEKRTGSGQTHDHPFPTSPFYPRIAEDMTKKAADAVKSRVPIVGKYGNYFLGGIFLLAGGMFFMAYDGIFRRPELYWTPGALYTHPEYSKHSMRMDNVVYVDVAVDGRPVGRIHIGLFHNDAPAWCENFHRLAAAGEGGEGNEGLQSLVGTLFWKCTGPCLFGGDSSGVDGKDGRLAMGEPLPEDKSNNFSFPFGVYAAGGFIHHIEGENDSNFLIMLEEGRVATKGNFTCVGMVVKGFSIVELLSQLPRQPYPYFVPRIEVTGCGISELDGDADAVVARLHKFHKGRVRRFLATSPALKTKYDLAVLKNERKELIREKKAQVEEELKDTKEKLAEASK